MFGAAPMVLADFTSSIANKLAARATPSDPQRDTEMRFAWTKEEVVLPPASDTAAPSAVPRSGGGTLPRQPPPASLSHSQFSVGSIEGRFTTKSLTTGLSVGGGFTKAEIGYRGDLRLQFDRPTFGGNLMFSLVGESGASSIRLEFKRNF